MGSRKLTKNILSQWFSKTAYDYQRVLSDQLSKLPVGLLSADMGVGKTGIATDAASKANCRSILIICPAFLVNNWERELDQWGFLGDATILSYNKVIQKRTRYALMQQRFDALILDEAHYLKNPTSKRTAAIYGDDEVPGIASRCKRVWALSGTFAPNSVLELWPHLHYMIPELIPSSFYGFRSQYCVLVDKKVGYQRSVKQVVGQKNMGHLNKQLDLITLRCKAEDVLPELPPIIFDEVEMDAVDAKEALAELKEFSKNPAAAMLLEMLDDLADALQNKDKDRAEEIINDMNEMHLSTLMNILADAKVGMVTEYAKYMLEHHPKLVIFAKHLKPIQSLSDALNSAGISTETITGKVSMGKRSEIIDKFQNDADPQVIVGQITACGVGVTLTAAHQVLFLEQSWVPAENLQAAKRCHRIGQDRPVVVKIATMANSIDQILQGILVHKLKLIAEIKL